MQSTTDPAVIADLVHVSYHWPDGIHTREELEILEPGRRQLPSTCPCGNCGAGRAA